MTSIKDEILPFVTTWMDLKGIMQNLKNKINQQAKQNQNRLTDIENRLVVVKGEGGGEGWTGSLGLADANYCIQNG